MIERKLEKYLRTRATTTPWQLEGCKRTDFSAAIVIPVLAEFEALPLTLESLAQNPAELLAETLVVLVVNNRLSVSAAEKSDNRQTLDWLGSNPCPRLNLTWVDATGCGLELPPKDGVGLARKIGFDLALTRLVWSEDPLLISLDADALVDINYLAAISSHFRTDSCAGACLPFCHQAGESVEQEEAIRIYELYLRSYRFGLRWAGSPYAFTSLGSALACRATAYVAAGGMRRRQAGEDFYFLQQLAKVGGVGSLSGTIVRPSPRFSTRVPFGTGRAVQAEVLEGRKLYRFISLNSFQILRDWLLLVEKGSNLPAAELERQAEKISPGLAHFLTELDFAPAWQKLQSNANQAQLLSAWHNWFDGLRTRQLLSRLEESRVNPETERLVAELLDAGGYPDQIHWAVQLKLLEQLQGVFSSVSDSP